MAIGTAQCRVVKMWSRRQTVIPCVDVLRVSKLARRKHHETPSRSGLTAQTFSVINPREPLAANAKARLPWLRHISES
jgi:hypothetical protein